MPQLKVPKGVKVSRDTLKHLDNTAFLARQKRRSEAVETSEVGTGYYPHEGNLCFRVLGFDVRDARKDKGKGPVYADDWYLHCVIADPSHKDDGTQFDKRYRLFLPKKDKPKGDKLFSGDAAELKQLLRAVLEDKDKDKALKEGQWAKIILLIAANEVVFKGRAWTQEKTDKDTGNVYTDTHLRVYGLQDDDDEPGTVAGEEAAEEETEVADDEVEEEEVEEEGSDEEESDEEEEDEDEDETEDEEEEEADDSEDADGGETPEGLEVNPGDEVRLMHPKYKEEIVVTVKSMDEDTQTLKGSYVRKGKKLVATFPHDAVLSLI